MPEAEPDEAIHDLTLFDQEYVPDFPVDKLIHFPGNSRSGDAGAIAEIIRTNGWHGALDVQRSTNHIMVGNHRFMAVCALGATTVPVFLYDVDDATARRINIGDNRASDIATYKTDLLVEQLQAVIEADGTLDGTGFDGDDLDALIASMLPMEEPQREDDLPPAGDQRLGLPDRRVGPPKGIEYRS